jgi:hypothetical protein
VSNSIRRSRLESWTTGVGVLLPWAGVLWSVEAWYYLERERKGNSEPNF